MFTGLVECIGTLRSATGDAPRRLVVASSIPVSETKVGDSVSIGYTLQVREKLKGKANVHRIPVNGGATEVGLAKMKDWLCQWYQTCQ